MKCAYFLVKSTLIVAINSNMPSKKIFWKKFISVASKGDGFKSIYLFKYLNLFFSHTVFSITNNTEGQSPVIPSCKISMATRA